MVIYNNFILNFIICHTFFYFSVNQVNSFVTMQQFP